MIERHRHLPVIAATGALLACASAGSSSMNGAVPVDAAHLRHEAMTTELFTISYTVDYGYRLFPASGGDVEIIPVFAGEGTEAAFGRFFSSEAMARNVGRKIYCRRTGERAEEEGAIIFKVRDAHIFAR